jgi:hypothetical protein
MFSGINVKESDEGGKRTVNKTALLGATLSKGLQSVVQPTKW